ncbi:hypothetical protein HYS94_05040 [Candidatus Daviesbacteria bacterium]|nr:hypothetical protein [Candidatus Daviesbacteria bacterium]
MFIAVAILILVVSIVAARQIDIKTTTEKQDVKGEQVESPSPSPTPSLSPSPSPSSIPKPSSSSTNSSVTITQDVKDDSLSNQNFNLSDFKYSSSSQINSSQNNLKLESTDDPKKITDWYKEKITSLGFKTKSFVQTNTNDYILNKLVGASGNVQVKVDIEKQPDASKTTINITLDAS